MAALKRATVQTRTQCVRLRIRFRFSYEALDPVLRRVLSDERVLAGLLPQMALESFIGVIK